MTLIPGTGVGQVGTPVSDYALGIWELGEDEALLIEFEPPQDAIYWNIQLADVWSRSLDFINHQSALNMTQAEVDADGRVRIVASWADPGVANWLDTVRRGKGVIILRNYSGQSAPVPSITRVGFAELEERLPPGTVTATTEQRNAAQESRRQGMRRLLGE